MSVPDQTSDLWNKRHSVAIGDVHECKLIRRKEITPKQVEHIWKSMTVAQYVKGSKRAAFVSPAAVAQLPASLFQRTTSAGPQVAGRRLKSSSREREAHCSQRVRRQ